MVGRVQSVSIALLTVQETLLTFSAKSSYYEGHEMRDLTFPIRVLKRLGIDTLIGKIPVAIDSICLMPHIVTNAAGGLNPDYAVGDLMVLTDVRNRNTFSYTLLMIAACQPCRSGGDQSPSWSKCGYLWY